VVGLRLEGNLVCYSFNPQQLKAQTWDERLMLNLLARVNGHRLPLARQVECGTILLSLATTTYYLLTLTMTLTKLFCVEVMTARENGRIR